MSITIQPVGEDGFKDDLATFGLTWSELSDGVLMRALNMSRAYDNPLYPATGPGTVRWLNTVRFLHELLLPREWEPLEGDKLQRKLIHRTTRRALIVMSGDKNTGVPTAMPRSRYPKGEQTLRAISANGHQLTLPIFSDEETEPSGPVNLDQYETWFLLTYVTPVVIQSELSRAVGVDHTGRADHFEPRILLPYLKNDGTAPDVVLHDDGDNDDGGTAIEVPVQPR